MSSFDPASVRSGRLRVAYFFTRFPHATETFLQREVRGMWKLGMQPELHSFHGGGAQFDGVPVRRFSKWSLIALFWRVPLEWWRKPVELSKFARLLFLTWPRDWLNYWENLYGAGIGVILAGRLRDSRTQHIHAAWASLPAMAAWVLATLNDISFSTGAHAYDLFEHGGDWLLREKCAAASFVHTSTAAGRTRLIELGVRQDKVLLARRGLDQFPAWRELRAVRTPLRIVCVARLVEKKGLLRQLHIYRHARANGITLEVHILGDGPMRAQLEREIERHHLGDVVTLFGHVPQETVWAELARADVLVHTGVVTASGDRDGLPNVVPEAMAAGVLVVTAPGAGVMEAIVHLQTGFVCSLDDPAVWQVTFACIRDDTPFCENLRVRARAWVESDFDARRNAALILARQRAAIALRSGDA